MHAELVLGDKINLSKHSGCILEPYMGRFMPHSTVSKHYKDCDHFKDFEHHQQTSPLHAGQK